MTARHITREELAAAERFVWQNGRLLDRFRFAFHFGTCRGGGPDGGGLARHGVDSERVLAALRPYQNPDGGFGHALEPDLRGPTSQPEGVAIALRMIAEVAGYDDPMVARACNWLTAHSTAEGGVPYVLPTVRDDPRAPWWNTPDDPPASLLPTAAIAGLLHAGGVRHPWLASATEFCWRTIEGLSEINPYRAKAVLTFLDHAPDSDRAERAYHRIAQFVLEGGYVALDPTATGEVHWPLDFAPRPDGFGRRMFSDDIISDHLDALVDRQQPDGGWTFTWPEWNSMATLEWRAMLTVDALLTLREYGRFAVG